MVGDTTTQLSVIVLFFIVGVGSRLYVGVYTVSVVRKLVSVIVETTVTTGVVVTSWVMIWSEIEVAYEVKVLISVSVVSTVDGVVTLPVAVTTWVETTVASMVPVLVTVL